MNRSTCDPNMLSRFFDQELGPEEYAPMREHVMQCAFCQRVVRENQAMSRIFTADLAQEVSDADLDGVEARVIEQIQRKKAPWGMKLKDLFVSRRFYVPVTAAATALVLFVLLMGHPSPRPGPSAIVTSFEGDVASVMILETPKSHQTILWISEGVTSNGGQRENQET